MTNPGDPHGGGARAAPAARPAAGVGVVAAAWAFILVLSLGPRVVAQELLGWTVSADALAAASVGVIAAGLLGSLAWSPGRLLRPFLWLMLVLVGAQWFVHERLDRVPFFATALQDGSFGVAMPAELVLNLIVTVLVVGVLLVSHRDRHAFYLAVGDPAATAEAIGWMRVRPGDRWRELGPILSVCITLGTLAFLVMAGGPSPEMLGRLVPFVPVVLGAAAVNAFNEEVTYKASILSVLAGPVGARNALRMVAAYFGIAHFYGVPYGVVGVILAWFLGWILAKSMLETRGLWWAWFIHFLQDVVIFGFMAVGAITPGG